MPLSAWTLCLALLAPAPDDPRAPVDPGPLPAPPADPAGPSAPTSKGEAASSEPRPNDPPPARDAAPRERDADAPPRPGSAAHTGPTHERRPRRGRRGAKKPPKPDGPTTFRKGKFTLRIKTRVMGGWQFKDRHPEGGQTGSDGTSYGFFLRQARLNTYFAYARFFRAKISLDVSDALSKFKPTAIRFLRDAWAEVRPASAFRLRFGYFKRPFSRLELTSPGKLPVRGRGLANGRILEDRGYGDRSVGAMAHGKIRAARLRWSLGGFQPTIGTQGIDVVGRLRADPVRQLSFGVSGGYKRTRNAQDEVVQVGSAGGDVRVRLAGLEWVADVVAGQDYLVADRPWMLGLVTYASYTIDLPKKLALQPVALFEWTDANLKLTQSEAIRIIGGLNLLWRKRFRLMPQVEIIRPLGEVTAFNPWVRKETYYVMLSLEI